MIKNKIARIMPAVMLLMATMQATARENGSEVNEPGFLKFDSDFYLWVFLVFMVTVSMAVVFYSKIKLSGSNVPYPGTHGVSPAAGSEAPQKKYGFWQHFDRKFLTGAVPVEREEDVMMHHDYDGIRELDNKLPPWWVWGFYITILWAVVYLFHFHVSDKGKLSAAEYTAEMEMAAKQKEEYLRLNADMVTEENVIALSDVASLEAGKEIYSKNCVVCHLASGGGQVGPNLTDDYWLHGGGIKNLFRVITQGVPAKGMIAWKAQLTPKQIQQVSSYVLTLQGTNPPAAKDPEGELWSQKDESPSMEKPGPEATAATPDSSESPQSQ